jgi:ADP-ribose pyrophosphatase YjhB (NUDIX family)
MASVPDWLKWAREIQSLAQTGLHFSETEYHRQRYTRLAEIAAEIVASGSGQEVDRLQADFLRQPGYATPKVDVRGAVFRNGELLLVQERTDEKWCLPGGWADVGESPAEMVTREVLEESGFEVRPTRLIGVYDANRSGTPLAFYHAYKLVFRCEILGGEAGPSDETLDARFFGRDEVPPLSSQRTDARHLLDAWTHYDDPARIAEFD